MKEYSKVVTLRLAFPSKEALDAEKLKSPCIFTLLGPKLQGILASKVSLAVVLLQSLPIFSFQVVGMVWLLEEKFSLTSTPRP